jgi:hypothetical protein
MCRWSDGMSITHTRHETPNHDGPIYLAEWQVRCPEPETIREWGHRSAHLLSDIDGMTSGPQS